MRDKEILDTVDAGRRPAHDSRKVVEICVVLVGTASSPICQSNGVDRYIVPPVISGRVDVTRSKANLYCEFDYY